jgi:bacterial/archaeal transporter family-2 protein
MAAPALGLVFAAGVAMAVQNLLLAAMVGRGLGSVTALAVNSAVGLALLAVVNAAAYGSSAGSSVALAWRWRFVLPGMLGTFVVFAVLFGFRTIGATQPVVAAIAGQVLAAVTLDAIGVTSRPGTLTPMGWIGAALFVAGACMVVMSRRG